MAARGARGMQASACTFALSARSAVGTGVAGLHSARRAPPARAAFFTRAAIAEPPAAEAGVEPEAYATLRSLKGSVLKVRRVLDVIRDRDYEEALMILEYLPQRCSSHVQDLVLSCASNAKNKGMKKSKLFVSEVFADQGPYLRRFQPRAQGRAYAIRKPTCHIEIKMKSHETSLRTRGPIKLSRNSNGRKFKGRSK